MTATASASGSWMRREKTMMIALLISDRVKVGLANGVAVILEADEFFRPPVAVPIEEAVPAGFRDRQEDEDREQEKRRRQKDDDDGPAVEGHPARRLGGGRRGRLGFGVSHSGQENEPPVASRARPRLVNQGEAGCLHSVLSRHPTAGRRPPGSRRPPLRASSARRDPQQTRR